MPSGKVPPVPAWPPLRLPDLWARGLPVLGLLALMTAPAAAFVSAGAASGTAANVDLSILSVVGLSTGNLGGVAGTAPPAFSSSATAVPLNATAGVPGVISLVSLTGTGNATAASDVEGAAGTKTSSGSGGVVNLGLSVADLPLVPPLLEISADTIGSSSSVTGDSGNLAAGGTFTLTNLVVTISGSPVSLGLPGVIAPNTSVDLNALGLAGVILHLNEVTITGNGLGTRSVARTALRVEVSALNAGLVGVVKGSVLIGQSSASLTADADQDGVPDGVDLDSDNDGIPDAVENANALHGGDTDGDGVPDYLDLDSDNDGIYDVAEAGHGAADADHNGRIDGGPAAFGANGLANVLETGPESGVINYTVADTDGDGRKNYVDLDSDNDSISDLLESGDGSLSDADHNGIADGSVDGNGVVIGSGTVSPVNSGGAALPDYLDPDSDGDGMSDIVDNGYGNLDPDHDGKIDIVVDADLDGISDSVDTQPGVFGGFPPAGCAQWSLVNPLDSDGDAFPVEQEYALGGNPLAGGTLVSGTAGRPQGLVLQRSGSAKAGTEKVNASVIRPQGRYDVTFTLLASATLGGSFSALPTLPVVSSNGDGTDTLTWTDLQAAAPLGPDQGFVRLQIRTGCHPLPSVSLVQGWQRVNFTGAVQSYGVNFTSLPLLTGKVSDITGNTLTTLSGSGLNLSTLLSGDIPSYVEFTDGSALGQRFDVSGGGINTLLLNPASANNTGAVLPSGTPGSHFVLRRHRTLGEVLPAGEFTSASSSGSADQVRVFNGAGYDIYFDFANSPGSPYWLSSSLVRGETRVIPPGEGLFIAHASAGGSTTVLQLGAVRYNNFVRPLKRGTSGLNFVSSGFPADASPAVLGMTPANGFTSQPSPGSASQIQVWKADGAPGGIGFTNHFLYGTSWYDTALADHTGSTLFKTNRAVFVLVRADNPAWSHPLPWNPGPWVQP